MKRPLMMALCAGLASLALALPVEAAGMLTAKNGMTLYTFDKDKDGMSACYDACATNWPPYLGKKGESLGNDWTLVKRKDGSLQWAYEGKPVYFFAADKKPGDMQGDGKNMVWHIIAE